MFLDVAGSLTNATRLPNVLFSRFLINLSQTNTSQSVLSGTVNPSRYSTLNFRGRTVDAIIDNLGAPLDFGEGDSVDEDHPRGCIGYDFTAQNDHDVGSVAALNSESLGDTASVTSDKLAPEVSPFVCSLSLGSKNALQDTRLYSVVTWV